MWMIQKLRENLWISNCRIKNVLQKYILEHNGVEVDPTSIFDVQVKHFMNTNVS